ncbi:MAG: VWA domain-containing protein [Acidobacteria bacterium]|nr:VWA domain-containing protein [Acidobacteriota bacterium]
MTVRGVRLQPDQHAGALAVNILRFGRVLRAAGLDVHHGRMLDALLAIERLGVRSRTDVRAALRCLLMHRHEDLARFDHAFDLFFRARAGSSGGLPLFSLGERPRVVARPVAATASTIELADRDAADSTAVPRAVGAYSPVEVLRTKDFAELTPAEIDRARVLLERLPWQLGVRRTRRWRPTPAGAIDLRRTLRRNLLRWGEVVDLPRRRRRRLPRPVVLIADVSGSMDRYSRMLLHFLYGLTEHGRRVESFVFATRLTRVTRRLAEGGGAASIERLVQDVKDWGGGTRIGDALRTFNTRWARRVMRHGPVVVIVSDGWDRGDPARLSTEVARLHRQCRRLIWLNPLLGSPGYEPLTRGMQAALRHVDDFLPAHNLASLEQLAEHLGALGVRGVRSVRLQSGKRTTCSPALRILKSGLQPN